MYIVHFDAFCGRDIWPQLMVRYSSPSSPSDSSWCHRWDGNLSMCFSSKSSLRYLKILRCFIIFPMKVRVSMVFYVVKSMCLNWCFYGKNQVFYVVVLWFMCFPYGKSHGFPQKATRQEYVELNPAEGDPPGAAGVPFCLGQPARRNISAIYSISCQRRIFLPPYIILHL